MLISQSICVEMPVKRRAGYRGLKAASSAQIHSEQTQQTRPKPPSEGVVGCGGGVKRD